MAGWTFCKATGDARWHPTRKRFSRPPTRVPQRILKAISYFQATLTRVLEGLNCITWVDDVIYWGLDETDLLNTLGLILERFDDVGLYPAAHKCTFFETNITRCGKVYSQGGKPSTILSGWPAWLR